MIVINQGNTSTKWGVFREGKLAETHRTFSPKEDDELIQELNATGLPYFGISVCDQLKQNALFSKLTRFTRLTEGNFPKHNYETGAPGEDRLANTAGALNLFHDAPILVIDFGTCITYSLINECELIDGAIAPGVQTRFRAMHEFTGKLPLLYFPKEIPLKGNSTSAAMQLGVYQGVLGELQFSIQKALQFYPELQVVLTGNDALYFAGQLEYRIFVEQNLTLFGIYAVAQRLSFSH